MDREAESIVRFYLVVSLFLFAACLGFGWWHGDSFLNGAATAFGLHAVLCLADLTRIEITVEPGE